MSPGYCSSTDVNAQTSDGTYRTPLHITMEFNRVDVVRVLLEHGANVGAKDWQGRTPLQIASERGYDEIMKLLSEHGAKL